MGKGSYLVWLKIAPPALNRVNLPVRIMLLSMLTALIPTIALGNSAEYDQLSPPEVRISVEERLSVPSYPPATRNT